MCPTQESVYISVICILVLWCLTERANLVAFVTHDSICSFCCKVEIHMFFLLQTSANKSCKNDLVLDLSTVHGVWQGRTVFIYFFLSSVPPPSMLNSSHLVFSLFLHLPVLKLLVARQLHLPVIVPKRNQDTRSWVENGRCKGKVRPLGRTDPRSSFESQATERENVYSAKDHGQLFQTAEFRISSQQEILRVSLAPL